MRKFRIKIRAWWASSDFVTIVYSTNGIFWKKIRKCERDVMDGWYYMTPLVIHFTNAGSVLKDFPTLESVLKYDTEQRKKVNSYNNDVLDFQKRKDEEKNKIYNKFS